MVKRGISDSVNRLIIASTNLRWQITSKGGVFRVLWWLLGLPFYWWDKFFKFGTFTEYDNYCLVVFSKCTNGQLDEGLEISGVIWVTWQEEMNHLSIRPHDCVDEFFVVDSTELMWVKQTVHDAKFCFACRKLYIVYKDKQNVWVLCWINANGNRSEKTSSAAFIPHAEDQPMAAPRMSS